MNVGLMSKERSVAPELKFQKQILCFERRTALSMTYWLQKCKTNNLVSNKNREVGFRLINIVLHISKGVFGIVS